MIPPARLRVAGQQVPGRILLAGDLQVPPQRISKVVRVHKVIARVIGRVDVDELDPAEVRLV